MLDIKNEIDVWTTLAPSAKTATANGTGVDLSGVEGAVLYVQAGTITDGTHTISLQESDDNTTFTNVATPDLIGTLVVLTSNSVQRIGYKGIKRYVRAVTTVSGATTGGVYAATIIRGGPARKKPLA